MSEVQHVSQLYETVTTVAVFFLFAFESVACYMEMWTHFEKQRSKDADEEIQWNRNRGYTIAEKRKENQAEKSAVQEINKQISSIQKQAEQREKQQKTQQVPPEKRQNQPEGEQREMYPVVEEPKQVVLENAEQQPDTSRTESAARNQEAEKVEVVQAEMTPNQRSFLKAFSIFNHFIDQHNCIIFSVLVIGLTVASTLVFSLGCYFCYLFLNVLFDFVEVQKKLREQYRKRIVVSRFVSSLFVLAILLSYWTIVEF